MADFIILRLVPEAPIDPAAFADYLTGLTISVFDVSFANSKAGSPGDPTPPIGTATFNAPTFAALPAPWPPPPPIVTYPAGTTIVQHFAPVIVLNQVQQVDMQSVATALIPYVAPAAEYPAGSPRPDLRIQFQRGGGKTIIDPGIYYEVALLSGGAPGADELPFLEDKDVSLYVTLPPSLGAGLAFVDLAADGAIPNYDDLLAAINTVLAADPGGQTLAALTAVQPLTVEQCRNIAQEIIWGAEPPLPQPTETIENLYTNPPNDGGLTNPNEQSRQQFEGQLNGYYATRAAKVERLTKYVYAVAGAEWCELQTKSAASAVLRFPVNPTGTTALTTIERAEVVVTGALGIDVPAEYFYALAAILPVQLSLEQRMKLATGATQQQNLTQLVAAYEAGVLSVPPTAPQPPVNPAQAVRLLDALSFPASSSMPQCPVASALAIWNEFKLFPATSPPPDAWRAYQPGDDDVVFWPNQAANGAAGIQSAFLQLHLCALTQGYVIANSAPPVSLADHIAQHLVVSSTTGGILFSPIATVGQLAQALSSDWEDLFWNSPPPPGSAQADLLPPFTLPGTLEARVAAFIRHVRKFFDLPTPTPTLIDATPGAAPTLPLPSGSDALQAFVTAYDGLIGGGFNFGDPLIDGSVDQAVASVFPGDPEAQAWLKGTVEAINTVCALAQVPGSVGAIAPSPEFSVAEALYARGFTSVENVLALTPAEFQDALRGTVAYDEAANIYARAVALGAATAQPPSPDAEFQPVNPGTLRNCIPPCHLSPLGPVAYLHELLLLSERSTCEQPFAAPDQGHDTLGDALAARRGPLGSLKATAANEGVPLPLIDIVNESLEAICATEPASAVGVVYDTAGETLAGHDLCSGEDCCHDSKSCKDHELVGCHDPKVLLGALPEHSTPATPTPANENVQPAAFNKLKRDFSSCCLPYSQALDVARTYLAHFCTSRFETMRTFRRCITEFVLDPEDSPDGFEHHLWRYPVRIDTAIEYLCITPEEYVKLFGGSWPESCSGTEVEPRVDEGEGSFWRLADAERANEGIEIPLPQFLAFTCLSYCEFLELWKSKFISFDNAADRRTGEFPDCEPCCLADLSIRFSDAEGRLGLPKLIVFVRLWQKLRGGCGKGYSFVELADICTVLQLFNGTGINPDFIRQLAAFQMLRDLLALDLVDADDPPGPADTGADRLHILALWAGPAAGKWEWAVDRLLDGVLRYTKLRYDCEPLPELIKLLRENLDPLSVLAGFDPANPTDTWHALPTHTLRFAEALAKIAASNFTVGEILYLFTADPHVDGDDPFALPPMNEGLDAPLGLPDDDETFSLWRLRQKLLDAAEGEEDPGQWTWPQIAQILRRAGFPEADLLALGQHFFPDAMKAEGPPVSAADRRYVTALAAANTAPRMWNYPKEGPFNYDETGGALWVELPLGDNAVIEQLRHLRPLEALERQAVQDLYFAPRRTLAIFAMLFDDFTRAEQVLIEKPEAESWPFFQQSFARWHRRREIICEHLSDHVRSATGQDLPGGSREALRLVRHLLADENFGTSSWENDNGDAPVPTWSPRPRAGALAALLGLTGTGLLAEYSGADGTARWRGVSGVGSTFGDERNLRSCPVPTVVPSLDASLSTEEQQFVAVLNGLALRDEDAALLGGAEGFSVTWTGALLVDESGTYKFSAGGPTPDGEEPHQEDCGRQQWCVMLKRGQRTWLLLRHDWPHDEGDPVSTIALKRGVYQITINFTQDAPVILRDEDACPWHSGFQLKYAGPDTGDRLVGVPHDRLFRLSKDTTLAKGLANLAGGPADFLKEYYTSTLRDIRRTYQRAFKALLLVHRFSLSAERWAGRGSELGYMLGQKDRFGGRSYYRGGVATFTGHSADFDFNLLPLLDDYFTPAADLRAQPSAQRKQALFDLWERMFDYSRIRDAVARDHDRQLWLLFDEAEEKAPAKPAYLLLHMGADSRHWLLDLHYFQDQGAPLYSVSADDLEDHRWVSRAWHADQWLQKLRHHFCPKDVRLARPALWASDDPGAVVPGTEEDGQPHPTGNANLSQFLADGCIECPTPRRYQDFKRLNDCLRERGRDALLAYLCAMNRVPLPWGGFAQSPVDLSALLLIDVEAGLPERASRIEEGVTALQTFVRRARLGLEPGWAVTHDFARMWDQRFATFATWQACKCRETYKENWIDWIAQESAQKVESYQFLQSELRRATLTIALPGGLEYWPDERPPASTPLQILQDRDASSLAILNRGREGLNLLGTPERDARPSWLAAVGATPPVTDAAGIGLLDVAVPPSPANGETGQLPFWIECAIRLGVRFYRIAAAGSPAASAHFEPGSERTYCCSDCGQVHPPLVDEYYFWLLDARFFKAVSELDSPSFFNLEQDDLYDPDTQESTPWHDPLELANLLEWRSSPMVRLAWCRVHNGEFKQPRRSQLGVPLTVGTPPDLTFVGRVADSLHFEVTGGTGPIGFSGSDAPGFRYDLAADSAIVLPLINDPPAAASPYPGGLPAYPYFAYAEQGAPLFPPPLYSPALAIACALRTRCSFEAALKWYALVYDPLHRDNAWMKCEPEGSPTGDVARLLVTEDSPHGRGESDNGSSSASACCDASDVTEAVALDRSVLLHFLETLLDWGSALMPAGANGHSPEAFQQARLILDTAARLLGPTPPSLKVEPPEAIETVAGFTPLYPPINPRLLGLYAQVNDKLALIRAGLNDLRLRDGQVPRDLPYWGKDGCCGCDNPPGLCTSSYCSCDPDWCHSLSPYRFLFLGQKAQELAGLTRDFGAALLNAFEKGDAEYLESLRAGHELELLTLGRTIRQDQWREADWQIQVLEKTKEIAQTNRRYYATLIQNGLNIGELQYLDLTAVSLSEHTAANIIEAVAEAMDLVPDLFVGFPCTETWLPIGTKLAGMFKTIARITNAVADMSSQSAGLSLTEAGWARRLEEWIHQVEVLDIEIQQIERQILAAERRRSAALQELNSQERQIENSREVQNYLRDKFTSHDLYLYLQKETAAVHHQMWDLAWRAAVQAERAFNFERGETARHFLPCEPWDDLHQGLLAGERLQLALRTMEQEYFNRNVRERELNKRFSLRLHFPLQFLELKASGVCEIELPEWMFDLDHPGHFMRRIKNVTLTIPCVTGPFSGVHCRLTLLSSSIRVDPSLNCPPMSCCGQCPCDNAYEQCRCDPRFMKHFGARDAIATSSGQNDSGLFELNFRDERYLPFEFLGAVSRWRIELPAENNFFDIATLSDVELNLNYTARDGGDPLRRAANEVAQCEVRKGWTLFDVRNEFPDAWQLFITSEPDSEGDRDLKIPLSRRLFPYLPCDRDLMICRLALLFETRRSREQACCTGEYLCCGDPRHDARPCRCGERHKRHCESYSCRSCEAGCCCECLPGCHIVEYAPYPDVDDECECGHVDIRCVPSADFPALYHGMIEGKFARLGSGRERELTFKFPQSAEDVTRVYLMCYYETVTRTCAPGHHFAVHHHKRLGEPVH